MQVLQPFSRALPEEQDYGWHWYIKPQGRCKGQAGNIRPGQHTQHRFPAGVTGSTGPLKPPASRLRIIGNLRDWVSSMRQLPQSILVE